MASLVKTAMVKIVSDDGDTQEKLDRIAEKAEELGRLNPDLKVKIDAAAAQAEMAVLRKEMKDTGKDMDDSRGHVSRLAQMLGGTDTRGEDGMGLVGALDSAGDAISGTMVMWGSLAVGAAVALAALMPFLAGLTLVTAGVTGFAFMAVPEFTKIWDAVSKGGKAWRDLSPAQKQVGDQLKGLKGDFSSLQKAIQPQILKAFSDAMRAVKELMPAIRPLIKAASDAIDSFLGNIDKWLKSSSGQKFIQWMKTDGPKALQDFGNAAWDTAKIIGRVFDFLYNQGETFDQRWRLFWHNCALVVDGFRTGFVQMGDLIRSIWDQTVGYVIDTRGAVLTSWFQALPQRIVSFFNSLPGQLFQMGEQVIDGFLRGIESAAGGLLGEVGHLASDVSGAFSKVLGIFSPSRVFHQHGLMIAAGLAMGMDDGHGQVTAAAQRMAAATLGGAAGGYASGGRGAQAITLQVEAGGGTAFDQFMTMWLRQHVRVLGGGDVQTAFGRT